MLKELRSQHRNILQMSFTGFSNNDIAEKLEMSHITVSQVIRSPLGQAYLNGLQDRAQEATLDVRKQLISLNKGALETFARILNPKEKAPHNVQLTAAKDVLDRNGFKAPDRLNIDMTLHAKTDAEIDAEILAMEDSINKTTAEQPAVDIIEQNNIEHKTSETEDSHTVAKSSTSLIDNITPTEISIPSDDDTVSDVFNAEHNADVTKTLSEVMMPVIADHDTGHDNLDNHVDLDEDLLSSIPADLFQDSIKN